MHTTDCKGMTHEEAALKQTAREAAIARREHQTEMERYETQSRLLVVQQKLSAAGLELDDLIELIEARQNGRY